MIRLTFSPPDGDPDWEDWMETGRLAAEQMLAAGVKPSINAKLYKRQRDRFLAATHKKCAYCESKVGPTERKGDVEHYRPKSRTRDVNGKLVKIMRNGVEVNHPGYYWLAYDWNNLLLRRVDSDGTVSTVMGNGFEDPTLPMDGALATDSLCLPASLC